MNLSEAGINPRRHQSTISLTEIISFVEKCSLNKLIASCFVLHSVTTVYPINPLAFVSSNKTRSFLYLIVS